MNINVQNCLCHPSLGAFSPKINNRESSEGTNYMRGIKDTSRYYSTESLLQETHPVPITWKIITKVSKVGIMFHSNLFVAGTGIVICLHSIV